MKNFALMSAIALTGAVGFTACSSNNDVAEDINPNYNPETNTVKTAITLSIDPNGSAPTRMAAGTVQIGNGTFRGMQDIWLIPSSTTIDAASATTSKIELGSIAVTGGFDSGKESQKTYTDKEVPVGTTNFLLLGKATRGAVSTSAEKLANGYTTNNIGAGANFTATTVGTIAINAEGIAPVSGATPALTTDWTTPASNLASYLTSIANAAGWAATTNVNLQQFRLSFLNQNLTAGSSASILLTLQKLYNAVQGQSDASVVTAIQTAITAANLEVKSGTAPNAVLGWVSSPTVLTNFPVNLGLPEGAAQYQWNTANSAFEYVTAPTLNASNTAVMSIVYPNELYYLTNTALKATDTKTFSWPTNVATWTTQDWSTWDDDVKATSRNIALINNIQYGTALLSTTVKSDAAILYDNAKQLNPDATVNTGISVTATTFPLTGVLVGGQPPVVGWNFLPTGTEFNKVVYDANVTSGIYAGGASVSAKNYTLVFDNLTTENVQKDVLVCLEFENNSGQEFYGSNGIILEGQKFYIVGRLEIGSNTFPFPSVGTPATQTTASDIAEKTASYYPSLTSRVFIQDFETIANFTLTAGDANTAGSLGKAIVTLPDLRTSSQTIGLSVDLEWKPGLTFDVSLGQ